MALVTMKKLLLQAENAGCGIGAFNVGNMEMIMGAVKAAEELNTPIIIQIAESRLKYSPLSLIGPMMVEAAKEAKVDIAVNFDHGHTEQNIKKALEYGFTSVMFDGSQYPFDINVKKTKEVVELASKFGADVEAELGIVGGSEGELSNIPIKCTDPGDAKIFCEMTGIDALAVAIGNAHGNYVKTPKLQFDVLKNIAQNTSIPLVLHGGSGISDIDFQKAISMGIVKINIATASFQKLTESVENYLCSEKKHSYFNLSRAMVEGTYENVLHHIKVFAKNEQI